MQPPPLPAPSSGNGIQHKKHEYTPHAISRSNELLSVARTSLRILQQQHQKNQESKQNDMNMNMNMNMDMDMDASWILSLDVQSLALYQTYPIQNQAMEALEEATLTLNLLDATLRKLSNLVRRRGTTNDPTEDINEAMKNFQTYSKMILEIIQTTLPQAATMSPDPDPDQSSSDDHQSNKRSSRSRSRSRSSGMRMKHYEMVANILQGKVEKRMEEFKKIMTVRGNVIKDLALRRKQLLQKSSQVQNGNGTMNGTTRNTNNGAKYGNGNGNGNSHHNPVRPMMPPRPAPKSGNGGAVPIPSMNTRTSAKSQLNSPLFTNIPKKKKSTPSSGYGGTGSGVGGRAAAGYGGGYGGSASNGQSVNPYSYAAGGSGSVNTTGMRRRGAGSSSATTSTSSGYGNGYANQNYNYNPYQSQDQGGDKNDQHGENKIHENHSVQAQIQMRRQSRQTQKRLENARQAERTLAELTTMFSKMSTLIHSQGETLVKIEDDVEAAMDHVEAGNQEIVKLYEWTQGNRALIIKMFAILIFLIIFMRFYG